MQRHDPRWWVWETTAAASAEMVVMAEEAGAGNQGTDLQGLVSSQWSLSQDDNLHADLHTLCMFSFKINVPFFQCPLVAHPCPGRPLSSPCNPSNCPLLLASPWVTSLSSRHPHPCS